MHLVSKGTFKQVKVHGFTVMSILKGTLVALDDIRPLPRGSK